jgi:RHS repeat-associated protein
LTKVTTAAVAGTQRTPATEQIYDFDKMGRVVKHQQKIDSQSYLLEYNYNLAGQLTSEKYPSGKIVNVGYDANGRLSSVADQSRTFANNFQFQNYGGQLSSMSFGNNTSQSFILNDRLQMTNQTLSKGSETIQKYDYGFGQIDANGNLDLTKNNGQLAKIESYIGANKQWTQKFSYDSIGRLSESKEFRGDTNALSYKQKFDFDRFGNLYRKNASNPTTGQETPLPFTPIEDSDINRTTNRFTAATGTTYNEAGQVVTDNKFRTMSFGYDANGRMVKASRANVPDALSVYDALGNRIAQKVNDIWQFVIYDAFGKLVAEYGGLNASDEGGVKYLLSDWQGSVRAVSSNAGFVQSRTDYQAFGEEIQSGVGLRTATQGFGGGINTKQGYGLTEKDDSTGLNHTWFRKNENRAGRWTSPDPYNGSMNLGNPQSFNRYSYVANQPTNFIDPSGLVLAVPHCSYGCVLREGSNGYYWDCIQTCYWDFFNIGGSSTIWTPSTGGDPGNGGGGGGGNESSLLNNSAPKNSKACDEGKRLEAEAKRESESCRSNAIRRADQRSRERLVNAYQSITDLGLDDFAEAAVLFSTRRSF